MHIHLQENSSSDDCSEQEFQVQKPLFLKVDALEQI